MEKVSRATGSGRSPSAARAVAWMCLFVLFPITMVSCRGSKELTRGKAKDLINASDAFKPQEGKLRLTEQEVQSGVAAGYWQEQPLMRGFPGYDLWSMTPRGHRLFVGFEEPQIAGRITVNTREHLKREISQVTGITQMTGLSGTPESSEKEVDFTWNWDCHESPPEVQQFCKDQPALQGAALLKLYDDGWRVEAVQFQ